MNLFSKAKRPVAIAALTLTLMLSSSSIPQRSGALKFEAGSTSAAAAQSGASVSYDRVVKVLAGNDKRLHVAVAGNFSSAHGCPKPWWGRSQNQFDDSQTQAMLQISLSSLLARMPVHVYTYGCDQDGYPIIAQIQVQERQPPPTPTPTPRPQDTPPCVPTAQHPCQ